jgi:hypothetical protein
MYHKVHKAHIPVDSNTLKVKQYFIIHHLVFLDAFCGALKQLDCPVSSKTEQCDTLS